MVSESTLEFIETHKPKFEHMHKLMRFKSPANVQGLIDLCAVINTADFGSVPLNKGCEIGSFSGESTLIFCEYLTNTKWLHCIDSWADSRPYKTFMEKVYSDPKINRGELGVSLMAHRVTSSEYFGYARYDKFDWVYIDGDHSYKHVSEDIQYALKHTHDRGIICGHDYGIVGVKKAVTEHLGKPDRRFCDGSWLKYKINLKTK